MSCAVHIRGGAAQCFQDPPRRGGFPQGGARNYTRHTSFPFESVAEMGHIRTLSDDNIFFFFQNYGG